MNDISCAESDAQRLEARVKSLETSLRNILELSYAGHVDGRADRLEVIRRHAYHALNPTAAAQGTTEVVCDHLAGRQFNGLPPRMIPMFPQGNNPKKENE